ncbi:MAG: hypothetical protein ABSC71_22455, partial [Candidatus Acidiferrales bacterium]
MNRVIGFAAQSERQVAPMRHGALLALVRVAVAFALAVQLCPLAAQNVMREPATTAPESKPPGATQQTGAGGQHPGAVTQLHTGTSDGLDSEASMQNLLADHQYLRMQAQLGDLPPDQAQLYRGILANRTNQLEQSVQLLEPLM